MFNEVPALLRMGDEDVRVRVPALCVCRHSPPFESSRDRTIRFSLCIQVECEHGPQQPQPDKSAHRVSLIEVARGHEATFTAAVSDGVVVRRGEGGKADNNSLLHARHALGEQKELKAHADIV
jgi:hypothetical protein